MSSSKTSALKNLSLVVASLFALFVVLELIARAVLMWSGDVDRFIRYASVNQLRAQPELAAPYLTHVPHRYLGYIPTPDYAANDNKHNSLGYRDDEIPLPKPPGEFRIVCLGGSTTYTPSVGHYGYSYPKVLERELHDRGYPHVRVINGGADGWTSYEILTNFFLRTLELDPDMVIVHLGVNDVFARVVWPPEAYRGDNSGYQTPLESEIVMPSIFEYSTLIRGLLIRTGVIQPHSSKTQMWLTMRYSPTFYGLEYERQQHNEEYPSGVFKEATLRDMLEANSPEYFKRNLENLLVLADYHGVDVLLSTVAIFSDAEGGTWRGLLNAPEFLEGCAEGRVIMHEQSKKHGSAFFNFHEAFPREDRYFHDAIHVTFEGVRLKGKLFADFLIDRRLVPSAPLNRTSTGATISESHSPMDTPQ